MSTEVLFLVGVVTLLVMSTLGDIKTQLRRIADALEEQNKREDRP